MLTSSTLVEELGDPYISRAVDIFFKSYKKYLFPIQQKNEYSVLIKENYQFGKIYNILYNFRKWLIEKEISVLQEKEQQQVKLQTQHQKKKKNERTSQNNKEKEKGNQDQDIFIQLMPKNALLSPYLRGEQLNLFLEVGKRLADHGILEVLQGELGVAATSLPSLGDLIVQRYLKRKRRRITPDAMLRFAVRTIPKKKDLSQEKINLNVTLKSTYPEVASWLNQQFYDYLTKTLKDEVEITKQDYRSEITFQLGTRLTEKDLQFLFTLQPAHFFTERKDFIEEAKRLNPELIGKYKVVQSWLRILRSPTTAHPVYSTFSHAHQKILHNLYKETYFCPSDIPEHNIPKRFRIDYLSSAEALAATDSTRKASRKSKNRLIEAQESALQHGLSDHAVQHPDWWMVSKTEYPVLYDTEVYVPRILYDPFLAKMFLTKVLLIFGYPAKTGAKQRIEPDINPPPMSKILIYIYDPAEIGEGVSMLIKPLVKIFIQPNKIVCKGKDPFITLAFLEHWLSNAFFTWYYQNALLLKDDVIVSTNERTKKSANRYAKKGERGKAPPLRTMRRKKPQPPELYIDFVSQAPSAMTPEQIEQALIDAEVSDLSLIDSEEIPSILPPDVINKIVTEATRTLSTPTEEEIGDEGILPSTEETEITPPGDELFAYKEQDEERFQVTPSSRHQSLAHDLQTYFSDVPYMVEPSARHTTSATAEKETTMPPRIWTILPLSEIHRYYPPEVPFFPIFRVDIPAVETFEMLQQTFDIDGPKANEENENEENLSFSTDRFSASIKTTSEEKSQFSSVLPLLEEYQKRLIDNFADIIPFDKETLLNYLVEFSEYGGIACVCFI